MNIPSSFSWKEDVVVSFVPFPDTCGEGALAPELQVPMPRGFCVRRCRAWL